MISGDSSRMINHELLDRRGGSAGHGAVRRTLLQDGLAHIVAIELAALPRVRWQHGGAAGTEDYALQKGRGLSPVEPGSLSWALLQDAVHLIRKLAVDDGLILAGIGSALMNRLPRCKPGVQ